MSEAAGAVPGVWCLATHARGIGNNLNVVGPPTGDI